MISQKITRAYAHPTAELQKLIEDLEGFGIRRQDQDLSLYKYVDIAAAKLILDNSTFKSLTR